MQQPLVGQGLIIETSRSHSDTPQSAGILWKSHQPDVEISDTTQHWRAKYIHAPGAIRTRNPSKRVAADPRNDDYNDIANNNNNNNNNNPFLVL
jgi:hypothetical protein